MFTENKTIAARDLGGGVTRKVLSYSPNLMACELRMEKGAVGALHAHPHEQIGYIVSGKLVYQEEGKEDKILETGDSYYVPPQRRPRRTDFRGHQAPGHL